MRSANLYSTVRDRARDPSSVPAVAKLRQQRKTSPRAEQQQDQQQLKMPQYLSALLLLCADTACGACLEWCSEFTCEKAWGVEEVKPECSSCVFCLPPPMPPAPPKLPPFPPAPPFTPNFCGKTWDECFFTQCCMHRSDGCYKRTGKGFAMCRPLVYNQNCVSDDEWTCPGEWITPPPSPMPPPSPPKSPPPPPCAENFASCSDSQCCQDWGGFACFKRQGRKCAAVWDHTPTNLHASTAAAQRYSLTTGTARCTLCYALAELIQLYKLSANLCPQLTAPLSIHHPSCYPSDSLSPGHHTCTTSSQLCDVQTQEGVLLSRHLHRQRRLAMPDRLDPATSHPKPATTALAQAAAAPSRAQHLPSCPLRIVLGSGGWGDGGPALLSGDRPGMLPKTELGPRAFPWPLLTFPISIHHSSSLCVAASRTA